uniref:Uncharacterized protein n=1 Tax=viral metagenome TaxID=1070528 RepID=A0A6M3KDF3_9ZZZZ
MKFPTFDSDGYPTDETLKTIEEWPYTDFPALMVYVAEAWKWGCLTNEPSKIEPIFDKKFEDDGYWWCGVTGGWSGNEDLVAAMSRNTMFAALCWVADVRGGYHEFHVSPTHN